MMPHVKEADEVGTKWQGQVERTLKETRYCEYLTNSSKSIL